MATWAEAEKLTLAAIAGRMESLGRNCEFGYLQRNLGVEPISLLRWAGGPTAGLVEGIRAGFEGLGEEMTGEPMPPAAAPDNQRWWLTCRRYNLLFHSGQSVAENSVEQATAKILPRMRWLIEKLFADFRAAEKLFVYSSAEFADPADGMVLVDAIREAGGHGPILLVAPGGMDTVIKIGTNVWGARMPKLTGLRTAVTLDMAHWATVLRDARRIVPGGV